MPGTWLNGLTEESHLSNAYASYTEEDKKAERKACEQAITDISEDQFLLEDMEAWAIEEEANYKPFYGEERKPYKMKLERATYDTSKPARANQPKPDAYEMHFLSEVGTQIASPVPRGEMILPTPSEIERVSKIHKKQIKPRGVKKRPEPKPKPEVKLEPCETYEEVKRWMEMAHPEYIDDEMMTRIEEKCRKIEKEF